MSVESVFEVTEYRKNQVAARSEQTWEGFGEPTINAVRRQHPRWTRLRLVGFLVNGELKTLKIKS